MLSPRNPLDNKEYSSINKRDLFPKKKFEMKKLSTGGAPLPNPEKYGGSGIRTLLPSIKQDNVILIQNEHKLT